jgi:hypothetical protein
MTYFFREGGNVAEMPLGHRSLGIIVFIMHVSFVNELSVSAIAQPRPGMFGVY